MVNTASLITSNRWPYAIFAFGVLAGSTGPIFLRLAFAEGVPVPVVMACRLLIASLLLTPFALRNHRDDLRRLSRRNILVAAAAGAIFAIQFTFVFESYNYTSILIAGVVVGSGPLWTALIERFVLHEHFDRMVWIGLALALGGGALIGLSSAGGSADSGSSPLIGAILALGGAVMAALYLVVGRSVRSRMAFIPFLWLIFTSGAATALLILIVSGQSLAGYSTEGYFWVLMTTLFPQIIAHGAFNYVLAYLPATLISMAGQIVGVISAAAAFFIFAELPAPLQIVGSAVITVGVMLAILAQARTRQPITEPATIT